MRCIIDTTVNTAAGGVNPHQSRDVSQHLTDESSRNTGSRSTPWTLQDSMSRSRSMPQTLDSLQRWRHSRRQLTSSGTASESVSSGCRRCDEDLSLNESSRCGSDLNGRLWLPSDNDRTQLIANHFCVNCQKLMVRYYFTSSKMVLLLL